MAEPSAETPRYHADTLPIFEQDHGNNFAGRYGSAALSLVELQSNEEQSSAVEPIDAHVILRKGFSFDIIQSLQSGELTTQQGIWLSFCSELLRRSSKLSEQSRRARSKKAELQDNARACFRVANFVMEQIVQFKGEDDVRDNGPSVRAFIREQGRKSIGGYKSPLNHLSEGDLDFQQRAAAEHIDRKYD